MQSICLENKNVLTKRKASITDIIINVSLFLFIFLVLCFPRMLQIVKLVIIIILLLFGYIVKKKVMKLDNRVIITTSIYLFLAAFWTLVGIGNGNRDKFDYAKVNFLWYFLWIFLFKIMDRGHLKIIYKGIIAASIYILTYNFAMVFMIQRGMDTSFLRQLEATPDASIYTDFIHLSATNTSMLMVTMPFIASCLIYNKEIKHPFLMTILLILNIVLMFMSGRRILMLLALLVVFALGFIPFSKEKIVQKRRKKLRMILYLGLFIVLTLYMDTIEGLYGRFMTAFTQETVRQDQMSILLEEFQKQPIFGTGYGKVLTIIPEYEKISIVEMTYHLMLYNTGIFGIILLGLYILMVITYLAIEIRKRNDLNYILVACLAVYLCGIIGTATNPYIGSSFDFHIFQMLPIFAIQLSRTKNVKKEITDLELVNQ